MNVITAWPSHVSGSVHGVAKGATIVSVKVLDKMGDSSDMQLLEGLRWISSAINTSSGERFVVNLSFAVLGPSSFRRDLLCNALEALSVVIVVAAGNQGPGGQGRDTCDFSPAGCSSVITVTATDMDDQLWEWTSRGPCVDLLAPGHDILTASHRDPAEEVMASGSSFAAPFVAGVVARHLENYNHQLSTRDMLQLLTDTATRGSTNAQQHNTPDCLLHRGCPSRSAQVVQGRQPLFPFTTANVSVVGAFLIATVIWHCLFYRGGN